MATEETLVIVKPDAVVLHQEYQVADELVAAGLGIVEDRYFEWTLERARAFYREHEGRDFFGPLVTFMSSGIMYALRVEGENAIRRVRDLLGSTDPKKADPSSMRARYGGGEMPRNGTHGSANAEDAERELAFVFGR